MIVVRYAVAVVLILVGLLWIGQGVGFVPGSGMSGQAIFAVFGALLVAGGAVLAWATRRATAG